MIKDYGFCHIYYPLTRCLAYNVNRAYACMQCSHWDVEFSHFCDRCGEELDFDDALSPTAPELCGKCRKEVKV